MSTDELRESAQALLAAMGSPENVRALATLTVGCDEYSLLHMIAYEAPHGETIISASGGNLSSLGTDSVMSEALRRGREWREAQKAKAQPRCPTCGALDSEACK